MIKVKNKKVIKILLVLSVIFALFPSVCVAAYGGVNYLQAKRLISEANNLAKVGNYDQAITDYAIAESKWIPGDPLKKDIDKNLDEVKQLKIADQNSKIITPSPVPSTPTAKPIPVQTVVKTVQATPTPDPSALTPNQEATIKALQAKIDQNKAQMGQIENSINQISGQNCSSYMPDWQAADACQNNKAFQLGQLNGQYAGLQSQNNQLALEIINIVGQR